MTLSLLLATTFLILASWLFVAMATLLAREGHQWLSLLCLAFAGAMTAVAVGGVMA